MAEMLSLIHKITHQKKQVTPQYLQELIHKLEQQTSLSLKLKILILAGLTHLHSKTIVFFNLDLKKFQTSIFNDQPKKKTQNQGRRRVRHIPQQISNHPTLEKTQQILENILQAEISSNKTQIDHQTQPLNQTPPRKTQHLRGQNSSENSVRKQFFNPILTPEMQQDMQKINQKSQNQLERQDLNNTIKQTTMKNTQILLGEYKNLLNINLDNSASLSETNLKTRKRRRRSSRTPKTKIENIYDQLPHISQYANRVEEIHAVETKSKQKIHLHKDHQAFNQFVQNINSHPELIGLEALLPPFQKHLRNYFPQTNWKTPQPQTSISKSTFVNQLLDYSHPNHDHNEQHFDPALFTEKAMSLNSELHFKIQNVIQTRLYTDNQLSLTGFLKQNNITNKNKALFFYHLLNTNFQMNQGTPEHFGQIIIRKKQILQKI